MRDLATTIKSIQIDSYYSQPVFVYALEHNENQELQRNIVFNDLNNRGFEIEQYQFGITTTPIDLAFGYNTYRVEFYNPEHFVLMKMQLLVESA